MSGDIKNKKFSIKDIIIIVVSAAALVSLLFMMRSVNEKDKINESQLEELSNQIKNDIVVTDYDSLVLNEINQAGWLEFYNASSKSISFEGCYVTNNGEVIYSFEQETLEPEAFLTIETGISLGKEDVNIIGLLNGEQQPILHVMFPKLQKSESYGCISDGSFETGIVAVTQNGSNTALDTVYENLQYSVKGGFYNSNVSLQIYAPEGVTITYTTDGTKPTVDSKKYEGSFMINNRSGSHYQYAGMTGSSYVPNSINMGTVVWAAAFNEKGEQVDEHIETYYINIGSSSDFYGLPVLSLVTEPDNLFDYFEGIYVGGRSYEDALIMQQDNDGNYKKNWEKPVYIEYFEADKNKTYEGFGDMSIISDFSVSAAQKSLQIKGVAPTLGASLSKYVNKEGNVLSVVTDQEDNNYKLRNDLAMSLLEETNVGTAEVEPVIVFLDGEYWGCYMLSAAFDREYFERRFQVKQPVITVYNNKTSDYAYRLEYEKLYSAVVDHDLNVDENFENVKALMDIDSYIDFICVNMYLANGNYSFRKGVMWKTAGEASGGFEDGRWRIIIPEMEYSMANEMTGKYSTYSMDSFLSPSVTQDPFFQSLMVNETFRNSLMSRMQELSETVFSIENVSTVIDEKVARIEKQACLTYKRFKGEFKEEFYSSEVEKIKTFFEKRGEFILLYTSEAVASGGDQEVIEAARATEEEQELIDSSAEEVQEENTEGN